MLFGLNRWSKLRLFMIYSSIKNIVLWAMSEPLGSADKLTRIIE
jgi:hypothetical protein